MSIVEDVEKLIL